MQSTRESWTPAIGERCVITSVPHPAFQSEIGREVTFLSYVPHTRWVRVDIDWRSARVRPDGVSVVRIRRAVKTYRIEQLSPLACA